MYGGIRNWKILGEDKVVKVCRSRPLFSLENIFNLKPRKYKKNTWYIAQLLNALNFLKRRWLCYSISDRTFEINYSDE